MRIAAKRLRYTLEICRPMYPGRLDEPVEAIKRVQTLLGEIHDCDVWLEHLDRFASAERKRITKMFGHAGRFHHLLPGIEHLRQDRSGRRRQAFGELVEYWAELGRRGLWDGLTGVVRPPYQLPANIAERGENGPRLAAAGTAIRVARPSVALVQVDARHALSGRATQISQAPGPEHVVSSQPLTAGRQSEQ